MKQKKVLFCLTIWSIFVNLSQGFAADKILKMSTTTSTQASGLLDILLPEFEKDTNIKVKVIAKGTGAAIRDGMDGNVDIIFVHAKLREEKFVNQGYGTKRYSVMHNDFIILGPEKDPAGIKGSNAADSFFKIAQSGVLFTSRGDDSGTHTKEQSLWKKSGIPLKATSTTIVKKGRKRDINYVEPKGKWYFSLGQGMGKVLTFANEKQAYILADRGTYLKYKYGRKQSLDLIILCEGDLALNNPYGIIPVNPKKHSHVKYNEAKTFAEWIVSSKGQALIANYKLLGKQLFYPDAVN